MGEAVNQLPTEILLNIFRFISDGVTLLDTVSLVCQRWNAVSKDPRAWAGACVQVSFDSAVLDVEDLAVARVMLRAPALRRVSFRMNHDRGLNQIVGAPSVKLVVERCRASIREMDLGNIYNSPVRALLLELMKRNRGSMRSLTANIRGSCSRHGQTLGAIRTLNLLEELTLEAAELPHYVGELRESLPALRKLHYSVLGGNRAKPKHHKEILVDILNGASASLRSVYISLNLHRDVIQALNRCTILTSVTLNSGAVCAVRGLRTLQRLTVLVRGQDRLPGDEELPASGDLAALRRLKVTAPFGTKEDACCGPMLRALGRAAPGVKTLKLRYSVAMATAMEEDVAELVSSLPQLRRVHLSSGGPSVLAELNSLPDLKTLDAEFRVPAINFGECCEMADKMMERFDAFNGNVRVIPILMKPITFVGKKIAARNV